MSLGKGDRAGEAGRVALRHRNRQRRCFLRRSSTRRKGEPASNLQADGLCLIMDELVCAWYVVAARRAIYSFIRCDYAHCAREREEMLFLRRHTERYPRGRILPELQRHDRCISCCDMRTLAWIVGIVLAAFILRDVFNALMVPGRMRWPLRLCRYISDQSGSMGCCCASYQGRGVSREIAECSLPVGDVMPACSLGRRSAVGVWPAAIRAVSEGSDTAGLVDYLYAGPVRIFTLAAEESTKAGTCIQRVGDHRGCGSLRWSSHIFLCCTESSPVGRLM
jgi:hypothetical protein